MGIIFIINIITGIINVIMAIIFIIMPKNVKITILIKIFYFFRK